MRAKRGGDRHNILGPPSCCNAATECRGVRRSPGVVALGGWDALPRTRTTTGEWAWGQVGLHGIVEIVLPRRRMVWYYDQEVLPSPSLFFSFSSVIPVNSPLPQVTLESMKNVLAGLARNTPSGRSQNRKILTPSRGETPFGTAIATNFPRGPEKSRVFPGRLGRFWRATSPPEGLSPPFVSFDRDGRCARSVTLRPRGEPGSGTGI